MKFTKVLNSNCDQAISDVRLALFDEAKSRGLMYEEDQPVRRKNLATGKSVKGNIDDIWCLVCSLQNSRPIDRVIIRNGKRSLKRLEQSRKLSSTQAEKDQPVSCDCQHVCDCHSQSQKSTSATSLTASSSRQHISDGLFFQCTSNSNSQLVQINHLLQQALIQPHNPLLFLRKVSSLNQLSSENYRK